MTSTFASNTAYPQIAVEQGSSPLTHAEDALELCDENRAIQCNRILIIDCQTTGPNPTSGDLLEIGWVVASASEQVSEPRVFLVKQPEEKTIPKRIESITGIRQEDMFAAIDKEEVRRLLLETLAGLDSPAYCIAHFARFEKSFLEDLLGTLPFELLCTYEIAKRLFPNLPSKGLRAVAGYFGSTCGELKRAASHVECTFSVWANLAPALATAGLRDMSDLSEWLVETPLPKRGKFEYPLDRNKRLKMPDKPGVYRMLSKSSDVLYVGKATSLKQRVNSYFRGQTGKDTKTKELLSQVWDIQFAVCESPLEAALLETDEIKRLDPPYNRALKRRKRSLFFYSPDFTSSSEVQDDKHLIGPFANAAIVEPLLKIDASLKLRDFIGDIFHYELPKVLLSEGFELFCINEAVEPSSIRNARSLLALGLWLFRRRLRERAEAKRAEELADNAKTPDATLEGEDDIETIELNDDTTLTIEASDPESPAQSSLAYAHEIIDSIAVGEKFRRMLSHIARQYLRAKKLTSLLHSKVAFSHKETPRLLQVRRGTITEQPSDAQLDSGEKQQLASISASCKLPWKDLDIDTYDRMSVLLTEAGRSGALLATK